jgi:phosphatidylglycerophosphate synthase
MDRTRGIEPDLIRWSTGNAGALALAGGACALGAPLGLLSAVGAITFAALVYRFRRRWTPSGHFGAANAVTFARIAGILGLPALPPGLPAAAVALGLFALDGVDGRIARRQQLAGPFGEFADKEGDALLVLMLCLLLYRVPGGLGPWILLPGMLRYAFVLFVALAEPPHCREEPRSAKGAWIAGLITSSLIVAVAAYPAYLEPAAWLAAAATAALCYSFADSTCRLYAKQATEAK